MSYYWMGAAVISVAAGAGSSLDNANQQKDSGNRSLADYQAGSKAIEQDAWSFYSKQLAKMEEAAKPSTEIALKNASRMTGESDAAYGRAADFYGTYDKSFAPINERIASDAMGYDTPARRDAAAAQAQADIGTAGDAAREGMAREVASRGGDVNSGNYQASLANASVREAAMKAGAGNAARLQVEDTGAIRLSNAANLGQAVNNQGVTQMNVGTSLGNAAVSNSQVPLSNIAAQNNTYNQGAQTRLAANQQGINAQGQKKEEESILGGMLTAGGGMLGGLISDKNAKKNRRPANDKKAMAAVRKTPVELWQYRKGSKGDDGGKAHIGPMAQDVNKNMGEAAAPGGKVIDPVNMNGITLAAAKNLDRRLLKIERKLSKV